MFPGIKRVTGVTSIFGFFIIAALCLGKSPHQIIDGRFVYKMNGYKNFYGWVHFTPAEKQSVFRIANISERPLYFRNAAYYAVGNDALVHDLEFSGIHNITLQKEIFTCDPATCIEINCIVPDGLDADYIEGFYITLESGHKICFESEP